MPSIDQELRKPDAREGDSDRAARLSELAEQIEHFRGDFLAKRFLIGFTKGVADSRRGGPTPGAACGRAGMG
jgi:hypothetical protein